MSPERTSHATSLPVRAERASRADQAPASDAFATLLGAHADRADRADRAPSRRERQSADDAGRERNRDRGSVDRPADVRARRQPSPAAEPVKADEPVQPADEAAATAAAPTLLAMLAVAPQQPAPTPVTAKAATAAEAAPVAPQTAPTVLPTVATAEPAAGPETTPAQPAAATAAPVATPQAAGPATTAPAAAPVEAAPTAPVVDAPAEGDSAAELPSLPSLPTQRSESRPAAEAPASPAAGPDAPTAPATAGGQGATAQQGDERSGERDDAPAPAPRVTQSAAPAPAPRVDVSPLAVTTPGITPTTEPKGAASLSQAPRAVGQLIQLASQNGVQHARLNLRPAELGGIEIRLQATAAGVIAHVVADSPEAARLLHQAGDDLRRSLASQNVELLSLDVSTSGEERRDASAANGGFEQFDETGPRGYDSLGRPQRAGESDTDLSTTPAPGTVLELPDGVLVDVLA